MINKLKSKKSKISVIFLKILFTDETNMMPFFKLLITLKPVTLSIFFLCFIHLLVILTKITSTLQF